MSLRQHKCSWRFGLECSPNPQLYLCLRKGERGQQKIKERKQKSGRWMGMGMGKGKGKGKGKGGNGKPVYSAIFSYFE